MEKNLSLLMQDTVFLIKRSLENSFYCKSLDLCQTIQFYVNKLYEVNFCLKKIMDAKSSNEM